MTRKHFNAIAESLHIAYDRGDITRKGIELLADEVSRFNDNFDYPRFLNACGVERY